MLSAAAVFGILILTAAAYFPVARAGFIWDDDFYVTQNPVLRTGDGLYQAWFKIGATPQYYPLVFTTFWIEHHLWGLNPLGYHVVNVVIHALSAVLVWIILRRLGVPGGYYAALIFALHPVHVESVAWVTERKNVLSGLLYLLAMLAYIRFASASLGLGEVPRRQRWVCYGAAVVFLTLALLSKTVTCSLPAALLLIVYWKRGRLGWRDVTPTLPLFAIGLAGAKMTTWVEHHVVGAKDLDLGLGAFDRVLLACRAAWFYAGKLAFPDKLAFMYEKWPVDSRVWWQYLFPLGTVLVLGVLWFLRRRIGRGPLVAALYFGGTLVPALGFIDVYPMRYSWVADHFQYLASLGPITLAGVIAGLTVRRMSGSSRQIDPVTACIAGAIICLPLGYLTARQASIYRDIETLWRDTIAKTPSAWMAYNNLGGVYSERAQYDEAERLIRKARELNPDHWQSANNLAIIRMMRGSYAEALDWAEQAVTAEPRVPDVYITRARILIAMNRYDEAVRGLGIGVQALPDSAPLQYVLGGALLKAGRALDAIPSLERAISLKPTDPAPYSGLGDALVAAGKPAEAVARYEQSLAILESPAVRLSLAGALQAAGQPERAEIELRALLARAPTAHELHSRLGDALRARGRIDQAVESYQRALALSGAALDAHYGLAEIYVSRAQPDLARRHLRELLKLKPDDQRARRLLDSLPGDKP